MRKQFNYLTNKSGIYFLYNRSGVCIYVGKSINLAVEIHKRCVDLVPYSYKYILVSNPIELSILEIYHINLLSLIFNTQHNNGHKIGIQISSNYSISKEKIVKYPSELMIGDNKTIFKKKYENAFAIAYKTHTIDGVVDLYKYTMRFLEEYLKY